MAETPPEDLQAAKRRLRTAAKQRRAAAAAAAGREAAAALRDHALAAVDWPAATPVSAYWPMGEEMDPRPLMHALHDRGHPIGLPVMVGKARPLAFRAWHPGADLVAGGFGTSVPAPEAPELTPRVLLVPLLAFDRAGTRLGYGGGFYDRTLAALRAGDAVTAVGLAYAGQEVERVPRGPGDERLDLVVTEAGAVVPEFAAPAGGAC